jgi:hypothetical protein
MLITCMKTAAGDKLRTIDALYEFPEGTLFSNKMFNKEARDDSVLIPHIFKVADPSTNRSHNPILLCPLTW